MAGGLIVVAAEPGRGRLLMRKGQWVLSLTLMSLVVTPVVVVPAIVIPLRLGLNPATGSNVIDSYLMSLYSVFVLPVEYACIAVVASIVSVLLQHYVGLNRILFAVVGAITGSIICPLLVVHRMPSFAPALWPLAICGTVGGIVYALLLFYVTRFLATRSIHPEESASDDEATKVGNGDS
jgi:hypothetical protein